MSVLRGVVQVAGAVVLLVLIVLALGSQTGGIVSGLVALILIVLVLRAGRRKR